VNGVVKDKGERPNKWLRANEMGRWRDSWESRLFFEKGSLGLLATPALVTGEVRQRMLPTRGTRVGSIRNPLSRCFSLQWLRHPRRRSYSGKNQR